SSMVPSIKIVVIAVLGRNGRKEFQFVQTFHGGHSGRFQGELPGHPEVQGTVHPQSHLILDTGIEGIDLELADLAVLPVLGLDGNARKEEGQKQKARHMEGLGKAITVPGTKKYPLPKTSWLPALRRGNPSREKGLGRSCYILPNQKCERHINSIFVKNFSHGAQCHPQDKTC